MPSVERDDGKLMGVEYKFMLSLFSYRHLMMMFAALYQAIVDSRPFLSLCPLFPNIFPIY